jgi:ELWxxDGT repeat protein
MVADINPGGIGSYPSYLTRDLANVNGTLFFRAYDSVHGTQLWKSDGTAAGTVMVTDINPGYRGGFSWFSDPTNVNGELFFAANDGVHGVELWKSDGTAAGTVPVADVAPGGAYNQGLPTNVNGTLFFAANDGTHGNELWMLPTTPSPSLAVSGFPTTTTAGDAGSLAITALNAAGTLDTSYTGTVQFSSTDPKAMILDTATGTRVPLAGFQYQFTAAEGGTHPFTVYLETAGYQALTAADTQAPTDNGSAQDIQVLPAAASRFTLSGFPSPVSAGQAGSFTVTAYDSYGNVATGYGGTVHFSSSDPNAILPANSTLSNGTGQFSATLEAVGTGLALTATDTQNATITGTRSGMQVPAASLRAPCSPSASGGATAAPPRRSAAPAAPRSPTATAAPATRSA